MPKLTVIVPCKNEEANIRDCLESVKWADEIFVVDSTGGTIRQLTSGGGSNEYPTWAPDGRHLAFQSNRTGSWQIYTMLLEGSEPRRITHSGNNTSPSWSGYFRRD